MIIWTLFVCGCIILQLYIAAVIVSMANSRKWITNSNVLLITAHPDDECM